MCSALPRIAGGKERLMNSAGLSDNVFDTNAGMPSTQNSNPMRSFGNTAGPIKFFHARESYTSDILVLLQGRSYSC